MEVGIETLVEKQSKILSCRKRLISSPNQQSDVEKSSPVDLITLKILRYKYIFIAIRSSVTLACMPHGDASSHTFPLRIASSNAHQGRNREWITSPFMLCPCTSDKILRQHRYSARSNHSKCPYPVPPSGLLSPSIADQQRLDQSVVTA